MITINPSAADVITIQLSDADQITLNTTAILLEDRDAATLEGEDGAYYLSRDNHTGTQAANTITGLATVATSGSYNDLSNKPTISTNAETLDGQDGAHYLSRANHTGSDQISDVTGLQTALDGKLESVAWGDITGTLSGQTDLQDALDLKLNIADYNDRFLGLFSSVFDLEAAHPTASAGDYAQVDFGIGTDVIIYAWDVSDAYWAAIGVSTISTTDDVPEGSSNLYHTGQRVRDTPLTGLSLASATAITAADSVLSAAGKLQGQASANATAIADKLNTADAPATVRGTALTGLSLATATPVTAADTVLAAAGKLQAQVNLKPNLNLFKNLNLTSSGAVTYQATQAEESGLPTLTMDTTILSAVFYDHAFDDKYFKVGATVTFSAEIFSDATGSSSGDITIQALSAAGSVLATSSTVRGSQLNTWHTLSTNLVLPANTATVRTRLIRRTGNTVVKFRSARLSSNSIFGNIVQPADVPAGSQMIFVSKTGNDSTGAGSSAAPYLTISKALTAATTDNIIIEVGGGDYRETVTVARAGNVWLRSKRGERARVFGSNQLVVTKTDGFTQVYQAPLADKPVGMGGGRGMPVIFEWGTPSKPIAADDVHFLQRGRSHRLPYSEMFEAATKADLDTVGGRGKWFWEAGTIFFAATDGGDATAKRYEARVRPVLVQSLGSIRLTRIDGYFSNNIGMDFQGIHTRREDCRVFGSYHDGFSDDANFTESYRDESAGNGNDGFNGTVTDYAGKADEDTRIEAVYFDPYGHDNGDDGISFHVRGDSTIYGGLFEYNTKADAVHVTGAACVCYNTVAQGTFNGFYAATAAPDGRTQTTFLCVGTKARKNQYSYRAVDNAALTVDGGISENPSVFGFQQSGTATLTARNCRYTGDPLKAKSGTVTVINDSMLT